MGSAVAHPFRRNAAGYRGLFTSHFQLAKPAVNIILRANLAMYFLNELHECLAFPIWISTDPILHFTIALPQLHSSQRKRITFEHVAVFEHIDLI